MSVFRSDRCDWLCVSLHGIADTPSGCDSLLGSFRQFGLHLERTQGTKWYRETYFFREGVTVFFGRRNKILAPAMVELRGDFFETFGAGAMEVALYFVSVGRVTRIDWCWDFVSDFVGCDLFLYPEDIVPLRRQKIEVRTHVDNGEAVYTGLVSGKSEFRFRWYDKVEETGTKNEMIREWWRFECVLRGNASKNQNWKDSSGNITIESVKKVVAGAFLRRFKCEKLGLEGKCLPTPRARDVAADEKLEKARERALRAQSRYAELVQIRRDFDGIFRDGETALEEASGQGFLFAPGFGRDDCSVGAGKVGS